MRASAPTDNVHMRAIATLPRPNARIVRQTRRCLLVGNGIASMRQLRTYCFPFQGRQHWHYKSIRRALTKLGARRVGWGKYALSVSQTGRQSAKD
jgi:hypothetical protein